MISIKNVKKIYTRGSRNVSAVDDVSLEIKSGDFVNIIGRSGSGKSTLLNMMAGMITPTSGEIIIDGNLISTEDDNQMSLLRNELMGFIPQGTATLPNLTVVDNVVLPFFLFKREGDAHGRAMYLLEMLGIADLAQAYPKELSGGEQRRTLIARALMNEPKIILADEPTSDLDVENTREVMETFAKINEQSGTTLVLVSHELDTLSYGKSIYTMIDGKIHEGNKISNK